MDSDYKEYLENIAQTLLAATKIIDDVDKVKKSILFQVFKWICKGAELSPNLIDSLKSIIRGKIFNVFHYGELCYSHLRYLDDALNNIEYYLFCLKSLQQPRTTEDIPEEYFEKINEFDIVILSDIWFNIWTSFFNSLKYDFGSTF